MRREPITLRTIQLILSLLILAAQGIIIINQQETNRLLSSFQRIDTVKESAICSDPAMGGVTPCDVKHNTSDNLGVQPPVVPCCDVTEHDPNTCSHWSSDCSNGECNSVCHLDHSEGIE